MPASNGTIIYVVTRSFKLIPDAVCQVSCRCLTSTDCCSPVSHSYYGYTEQIYGAELASAYYILSLRGGFR